MGTQVFPQKDFSKPFDLKKPEKQVIQTSEIPKSKGCVIVQTCDAYKEHWDSFFWSFCKYWDHKIDWPIYFCNEDLTVDVPGFNYFKTGEGSHSTRLAKILDALEQYEYVFYMLEDFWMTDCMTKEMFDGLFNIMYDQKWDSLRIASHQPAFYKLEATQHVFQDRKILKFAKDSDWQFSQQAAFWNRAFLRSIVVEPNVSEKEASSSITGEIAMDIYLRETQPNAEIYLYNYQWYPVSGAIWRGKINQMGEQINFLRQVENLVKEQFY